MRSVAPWEGLSSSRKQQGETADRSLSENTAGFHQNFLLVASDVKTWSPSQFLVFVSPRCGSPAPLTQLLLASLSHARGAGPRGRTAFPVPTPARSEQLRALHVGAGGP